MSKKMMRPQNIMIKKNECSVNKILHVRSVLNWDKAVTIEAAIVCD